VAAVGLLGLVVAGGCDASARRPAHLPRRLDAPVACDRARGSCWVPGVGMRWQWNLSGRVTLTVKASLYDIDWEQPSRIVARLHAAGGHAACYVDAGSWERWRPDAGRFPRSVLGKRYVGYPDERWLDVRRLGTLAPIMRRRLDACAAKGFDSAQFDNLDGYGNNTGFPLTQADDRYYAAWLANAAHARGLSAAFENALENVPSLVGYYDWAISEDCVHNRECQLALPFIRAGKFFGDVEYQLPTGRFCRTLRRIGISGIAKDRGLHAPVRFCR
jgi:hypothetical protein